MRKRKKGKYVRGVTHAHRQGTDGFSRRLFFVAPFVDGDVVDGDRFLLLLLLLLCRTKSLDLWKKIRRRLQALKTHGNSKKKTKKT